MRFSQGLGCPPCSVNFGPNGCVPCEPMYGEVLECQGCFDPAPPEQSFFVKHDIWPAVVSGVIIAVATGITVHMLNKRGIKTA